MATSCYFFEKVGSPAAVSIGTHHPGTDVKDSKRCATTRNALLLEITEQLRPKCYRKVT